MRTGTPACNKAGTSRWRHPVDLAVTTVKPDNTTHGHVEIGRARLFLMATPEVARQIKGRSLTAALLADLPCLTGWSVLPDYLAAGHIASGRITELPTIRPGPENLLYLA